MSVLTGVGCCGPLIPIWTVYFPVGDISQSGCMSVGSICTWSLMVLTIAESKFPVVCHDPCCWALVRCASCLGGTGSWVFCGWLNWVLRLVQLLCPSIVVRSFCLILVGSHSTVVWVVVPGVGTWLLMVKPSWVKAATWCVRRLTGAHCVPHSLRSPCSVFWLSKLVNWVASYWLEYSR